MNAPTNILEGYMWLVVLSLWTVTGGWDLVERLRGKVVDHART